MMKYYYLLFIGLVLSACVSKKTLQTTQLNHQRAADSLAATINQLSYQKDTLKEALTFERGANYALLITQDKIQDRLDVLQKEIDQLGNNASSSQQDFIARLRQKDSEIESRQGRIDAITGLLTKRAERLAALEAEFPALFKEQEIETGWELRQRNGQLVLSVSEDNLFRTNSTSALTSTGKYILDQTAALVLKYPEMQMQVIGHTDNQPITRQSLDNWQYSALRAVSVVKYLTGEGELGANRVLAATKSEFEPLESNETAEGRSRNRRIDLIIAPREADLERDLNRILKE